MSENKRNIVIVGSLLTTTEIPPTLSSIGVTEDFYEVAKKAGPHELGSAVAEELIETFDMDPHSESTRRLATAALLSSAQLALTDPSLGALQYMQGYQDHMAFRDVAAASDAARAEVMEPAL